MNALVEIKPQKPQRLRDSQLPLYRLLSESFKNQETVGIEEITKVYVSIFGDTYWKPVSNNGVWTRIKVVEEKRYLQQRALAWFKYTLGVLVVQGYCAVLPKFQFKDIDPKAITAQ